MVKTLFMDYIKKNLPASQQLTYFNTPGIGLISNDVHEFRKNLLTELHQTGSQMMENNRMIFPEVREKIGEVFNADPGYIALLPAFSFGFNAILEGLRPGLKVLLVKEDYPSINLAVESRDFKVSYIGINSNLEEDIYRTFEKDQPEVFIFSQVQWISGMKIDFEFIKKLKKDFPDTLFIGDGTQHLGTEKFDFKNSGLDVLGASGYKWLGAGLGNGFFMFKPGIEEFIKPKNLGYASELGKYKEQGDTLIGKFEGNHLSPGNIGSLKVALSFLDKIGMDKIENRIKNLKQQAKIAFTELGLLEETVVKRTDHSSIFNLKGDQELFDKLQNNNVICSQRGDGIRVGIHYYNEKEDLEKLVKIIKE